MLAPVAIFFAHIFQRGIGFPSEIHDRYMRGLRAGSALRGHPFQEHVFLLLAEGLTRYC